MDVVPSHITPKEEATHDPRVRLQVRPFRTEKLKCESSSKKKRKSEGKRKKRQN
jgi:hypothetical protein